MPETRALFVRYQTLIRVGATRASIIRSWSAKTAAQKRVWVAAYHDCTTEDNNVVTASAAANVADVGVAAAEALINNDPASWRRLKTERVAATARFTELKAALGRQRDVWEALRGIEAAQSHPAPLSTNHALNQRNAAANAIRACDARLAAYERLRAYPPVPLDGGGLAKMPAKWVVGSRKGELQRDRRAVVGLQRPGPGSWQERGVRQGGQGVASIWMSVDQNNNIIDRVFRKEVVMDEYAWRDPKLWAGDVRQPTGRYPYELSCPNSLLNIPGLNAVPVLREGLHAGLLLPAVFAYRIYTEFSPHGDLGDLIEHYAHVLDKPIPEPMIWNVAESLALCGFAMEHGHINNRPGKIDMAPNWRSIVHRDLKPLNVLLNSPDPTLYPQYPHAVVTDFGLAFTTAGGDPTNPQWWNNDEGTPSFRAPEQRRFLDMDTLEPIDGDWRLGPWTNVYGIGLILYCLITLRQSPPGTLYLGDGEDDERLKPPEDSSPSDTYSPELRELVWQCLQFDDTERIEFQDMLREIRLHTNIAATPEHYMRNGTANPVILANFSLQLAAEQYRVGMALPPAPA